MSLSEGTQRLTHPVSSLDVKKHTELNPPSLSIWCQHTIINPHSLFDFRQCTDISPPSLCLWFQNVYRYLLLQFAPLNFRKHIWRLTYLICTFDFRKCMSMKIIPPSLCLWFLRAYEDNPTQFVALHTHWLGVKHQFTLLVALISESLWR